MIKHLRPILVAALIMQHSFVLAAEVIRVGVQNFAYFPHYDFTDKTHSSLAERVLLKWADANQIEIEFVPLPTKRLEHEFFVKQGIDWLFPANPRWFQKYEEDVYYSQPIVRTLSGTMVLSENVSQKTDWFTSLSVPFGFTPVKYQNLIAGKNIVVFNTPTAELALQMVQVGNVSGADVEYNVAQHFLSQWPNADAMQIDMRLPHILIDFHLASIHRKAHLKAFDQWLKAEASWLASVKKELNIVEYWPSVPTD